MHGACCHPASAGCTARAIFMSAAAAAQVCHWIAPVGRDLPCSPVQAAQGAKQAEGAAGGPRTACKLQCTSGASAWVQRQQKMNCSSSSPSSSNSSGGMGRSPSLSSHCRTQSRMLPLHLATCPQAHEDGSPVKRQGHITGPRSRWCQVPFHPHAHILQPALCVCQLRICPAWAGMRCMCCRIQAAACDAQCPGLGSIQVHHSQTLQTSRNIDGFGIRRQHGEGEVLTPKSLWCPEQGPRKRACSWCLPAKTPSPRPE